MQEVALSGRQLPAAPGLTSTASDGPPLPPVRAGGGTRRPPPPLGVAPAAVPPSAARRPHQDVSALTVGPGRGPTSYHIGAAAWVVGKVCKVCFQFFV